MKTSRPKLAPVRGALFQIRLMPSQVKALRTLGGQIGLFGHDNLLPLAIDSALMDLARTAATIRGVQHYIRSEGLPEDPVDLINARTIAAIKALENPR